MISKGKTRSAPKKKKLVLCDFDGTITKADITDNVLNKFSKEDWLQVGKQYDKGQISHLEMNKSFAKTLEATPSEIMAHLNSQEWLREGFGDFVEYLRSKEIPLIVVSSGWDVYIEHFLQEYPIKKINNLKELQEINIVKNNTIYLISNQLSNISEKQWEMKQLWKKISCQISSPCKGEILNLLSKQFEQIIVIGNSYSDICMVEKADSIFSTNSLTNVCKEKNISTNHFEDFNEIIKQI